MWTGWDCGRCRLDGPNGLLPHCRFSMIYMNNRTESLETVRNLTSGTADKGMTMKRWTVNAELEMLYVNVCSVQNKTIEISAHIEIGYDALGSRGMLLQGNQCSELSIQAYKSYRKDRQGGRGGMQRGRGCLVVRN